MNRVILILMTFSLVVSGSMAETVTLEASGTVAGNELTEGPLAGAETGMDVNMVFSVDSEEFFDVDPGHCRRYQVSNDSFTLTTGDHVLDNISGQNYVNITNDYWVVDGVHWFESNIGYGYWFEFELWGNNGDMFPSTDILECGGVYGPDQFEDTSWQINWAFFVQFEQLIIHAGEGTGNVEPAQLRLLASYPNPFNPSTTIEYGLETPCSVRLTVFDIKGQLVDVLSQGPHTSGIHQVVFDGSGLASGVYVYSLTAGDQVETRKMVLVR